MLREWYINLDVSRNNSWSPTNKPSHLTVHVALIVVLLLDSAHFRV